MFTKATPETSAHLIDCLKRLKSARATASKQTMQIMVMTIVEISFNNTRKTFADIQGNKPPNNFKRSTGLKTTSVKFKNHNG